MCEGGGGESEGGEDAIIITITYCAATGHADKGVEEEGVDPEDAENCGDSVSKIIILFFCFSISNNCIWHNSLRSRRKKKITIQRN